MSSLTDLYVADAGKVAEPDRPGQQKLSVQCASRASGCHMRMRCCCDTSGPSVQVSPVAQQEHVLRVRWWAPDDWLHALAWAKAHIQDMGRFGYSVRPTSTRHRARRREGRTPPVAAQSFAWVRTAARAGGSAPGLRESAVLAGVNLARLTARKETLFVNRTIPLPAQLKRSRGSPPG